MASFFVVSFRFFIVGFLFHRNSYCYIKIISKSQGLPIVIPFALINSEAFCRQTSELPNWLSRAPQLYLC